VDAGFVWTEPHSRRLKIKLTIQKEVFVSTILQQIFIIEFVVTGQQCEKCQRVMAKDTWNAVIQARQKVEHKKTFLFIEQLILKHNAHHSTLNIKEQPDGLDFFFGHRSHAMKLLDFLQAVSPVKFKTSEQLVSHDEHSNVYNYKYTFSVEVAPVCRDDLVCLPAKLANSLGLPNSLVLVSKMSSNIHLVDPLTLSAAELNSTQFWQAPFRALTSQQHMIQYAILDVIPVGPTKGKWVLADVQLARNSDLGANDIQFATRTHLGHLLHPGDIALGYDLSTGNFNDSDVMGMRGKQLPDVVLVRKYFAKNRKASHRRNWKIKRLEMEDGEITSRRGEVTKGERDYEQFLRDLEEDPELRSNVLLYKADDGVATSNAMQDDDDDNDDLPEPTVDELLNDMEELSINEDE